MEFLRKYLTQIQAQLRGLTISQRLLIGLLAVIMVGTIFLVVVWSAKPQMVPLIPQSMTPDQIAQVEMALKGKYDYQVSGDRVLVPQEQAYAIRGMLGEQRALPKDLSTAFTALAMSSITFDTDANAARKWNYAVERELSNWLSGFSYVETASVIIARGQPVSLGRQAMPSTATVILKLKGNEPLSSGQVLAIADMVSGAVSGMKREDVHITEGQHSYHAPAGDTQLPADMLSYKRQVEDDYVRKLAAVFDYMGDVKIAVNAIPNLSSRTTQEVFPDAKRTVSKELETTSHITTTSDGAAGGGEPGVTSNTSATATEANGGGRRSNSSSTDTTAKNEVRIGTTTQTTVTPPGVEISELTASLSIPRTYLVSLYRHANKDPKADPDDKTLQTATIDDAVKKTKDLAMNVIGAKATEQVRVDWYDDTIVPRAAEALRAAGGAAGGASIGSMVTQYARQGVLALVALGALGMMLMMVRKAVPSADGGEIDTGIFFGGKAGKGHKGKKRGQREVDQLDASEDVFGEANEGDAVLTGIELDDETLASRKMVDEVSVMIKENPENAAALVKRWMGKSK